MASISQEYQECDQTYGSSKVKVTILASEWGSSKGGLSTINRELAIQLAKCSGVEITFFLPKCSEEDKKEALDCHKINIIEARQRLGFDELEWLSFPPEHLQIDIIIGHGVKLGRQAQIIKDYHKCRWVQVVHTDPEEQGMFKSHSNPISKGVEKHKILLELCEMADFVIGIGPKLSETFRSYLCHCQKDQTVLDFTPSIFDEFASVEQVPDELKCRSILVFGRGDAEDFELKGFDIAAKAVASLPDTRLVFVGAPDGKHEEIAEKLCGCGISASRLKVRGYEKCREGLKQLFCQVDLALMPSRTEGFGLTGLEALSAGLPVLVSKNSGFGEALSKVPFGSSFVIDSEDPEVWAAAIHKIWDKDRLTRLKEAKVLRTSYEERYNWTKQCNGLVTKMVSLANAASSSGQSSAACGDADLLPSPAQLTSRKSEVRTEHNRDEESHGKTEGKWRKRVTQEVQGKTKGKKRKRKTQGVPHLPMRMDCEIYPQNGLMAVQYVLNLIARRYLQTVKPSTVQEYSQFVTYLEKMREVLIVSVETGSLIITVECGSLQILDQLWEDYCSGYLNEMAQKYLVTDDILKECSLLEVKLITTILEEDYKACQEFFFSDDIIEGDDRAIIAESDFDYDDDGDNDDDDNDGNDADDYDMEGEDIIGEKALRHRHECQELPVQAPEDSNKEDSDQGNPLKMTAPSPPSPSGYLHNLCRQGNIIGIWSYLQGIDDVNKLEERIGFLGFTPLHEATSQGHTRVVRLLLLYGANANARANGLYTPLHIAASMDNTDCLVELLKHGADITSRDQFGKTPYETAMIRRCKKSAEILKSEESNQTKADTEVTDSKTELERVMSTMEDLKIDVLDVKRTVGEMRPLAIDTKRRIELPQASRQANLPSERSKVLRHQHERQEPPVQAQEDSKKEDTDQGNKQKFMEDFRFTGSELQEFSEMEQLKEEVDKPGALKRRLEKWREVEVDIAIAGAPGTGKSSFINAIRGLNEDDEGAAEVSVLECTTDPTPYNHPTNHNIKFWDLPGLGTPKYPDLETYCEKVNLEKYHVFLFFIAGRFSKDDFELATKIRDINNKIIFVRTNIDMEVRSEKRKRSFNEEAMLAQIRRYCVRRLGDWLSSEEDVFLISNYHPDSWDFARLTSAILNALPACQRESLTLSLGNVITRSSEDIIQRKVEVLRGRIWMVASATAVLVPLPGLFMAVDVVAILDELGLYRSQLGLPEIGSAEFVKLHHATKEKIIKVSLTTAAQLSNILAPHSTEVLVEEVTRFIPLVSNLHTSIMPFGATCYALNQLLKNVEEAALLVQKETAAEKDSP